MSSMNFSLKRNIMTFVLYFGYQNSRAIHIEKGIIPVQNVLFVVTSNLVCRITRVLGNEKFFD
jgi:hypothetical protein